MIQGSRCSSHEYEYPRCVRYEPDADEPLSIAVATALSQYHDEDVMSASTCLYEYVDPDAIDALFADTAPHRSTTTIEITADELSMTICPDCIEVRPAE